MIKKEINSKDWYAICRSYGSGVLDALAVLEDGGGISSPLLDDMPHGSVVGDPVFDSVQLRMASEDKVDAVLLALSGIDQEDQRWVLDYIDCPTSEKGMFSRGFRGDWNKLRRDVRKTYKQLRGSVPDWYLERWFQQNGS